MTRNDAPDSAAGSRRVVRFGRYELVARLGQGGMAQVFLARHRGPMGFEKLLVIKKIHSHLANQQAFIEMFLDEARIAARINNHRVVQIYELGRVSGQYFIAMEYLAGESLAFVIKRLDDQGEALDPMVAARIIADTAEGLHAAHELTALSGEPLEVVHRDVSPGNIVVLYDGGVKVVDFGVAKAKGKIGQTTGGEIKGKFSYMSPEQVSAQDVDRRADVFALGIVLWEILAMRRLFRSDNDAATVRAIMEGAQAPPSIYGAAIPRALDAIVMKALAPRRADRYQSAHAMQADLEDFLHASQARVGSTEIKKMLHDLFPERITARNRLLHELSGPLEEFSDSAVIPLEQDLIVSSSSSVSLPGALDHVVQLDMTESFEELALDVSMDAGASDDEEDADASTRLLTSDADELQAAAPIPFVLPSAARQSSSSLTLWLVFAFLGLFMGLGVVVWFIFARAVVDEPEGPVAVSIADEPDDVSEPRRADEAGDDEGDEAGDDEDDEAGDDEDDEAGDDEDDEAGDDEDDEVDADATAAPHTPKKPKGPKGGAAKPATGKSGAGKAEVKELVTTGREALSAGRYPDARAAFSKALAADSRSHAAASGLATVAFESGDLEEAISKAKRAVKLSPKSVAYRMLLGKAYFATGRYADAVKAWEAVLAIDPDNAKAKKAIDSARARM